MQTGWKGVHPHMPSNAGSIVSAPASKNAALVDTGNIPSAGARQTRPTRNFASHYPPPPTGPPRLSTKLASRRHYLSPPTFPSALLIAGPAPQDALLDKGEVTCV